MKQKTSCLRHHLMKISSVESHEQEVGWIKGSSSISGALCATRSPGKITAWSDPKWSNSPDPHWLRIQFIYSKNSKSHFVVCKRQECDFFLMAQFKNKEVTASDARCTYYQWLAPCRIPVKHAGNPPRCWENPCSHNLSQSAGIASYPVCTVSWGSSGPARVSIKSNHIKVCVQVLLARAR